LKPPRNTDIDVVEFLTKLGIQNIRVAGDEVNFSCPSEDHRTGDKNPSASMNMHTTAWNCFGCGRRGNAVTFLAEMEGVNTITATRWIREAFDKGGHGYLRGSIGAEFRERWKQKPEEDGFVKLPDPPLDPIWMTHFKVNWDQAELFRAEGSWDNVLYLMDRGFAAHTLSYFQVGYDEEDERIVLPLHSLSGTLVGFKARATRPDQEPRYRVLGKPYYPFDTCSVSDHVFNAHRVENHHIIICEGELNAMMLWQYGHRNVVAISGAQMSKRQAEIIKQIAFSATLYFDSDKAGNTGMKLAATMLHDNLPLDLVPPHHKDPAESTAEEVQDLLNRTEGLTRSYLGHNNFLDTIISKET
jgi:DNA primase